MLQPTLSSFPAVRGLPPLTFGSCWRPTRWSLTRWATARPPSLSLSATPTTPLTLSFQSSTPSFSTCLCDKADDEYGGRLPVHVRCLLDEFANIGQIPKFERLIATIRSREISASIILQSQSQLKAIYKDNRPFQPHAFTLLSSEGLGHFPTSYFQPTPRRAGGRKYGKGTLFLCLLRKFFLHYLQHREKEK